MMSLQEWTELRCASCGGGFTVDNGPTWNLTCGPTHNSCSRPIQPVNPVNVPRVGSQIWIAGLGWIDSTSVNCRECGDQGTIVTGWADDGDAENGPAPHPTEFRFCSCAAGIAAWNEDKAEADRYEAFCLYMDSRSS